MKCPECEGEGLIPDGVNRKVSCPLCSGKKELEIEDAINALFKFNRRMVDMYNRLVLNQERMAKFIDRVRAFRP
jgi:hypothetical protein